MKVIASNVACIDKSKRTYDGNDRYYVSLVAVDDNDETGQIRATCPPELYGTFKRLTTYYDVELSVTSGKSGTYLDVLNVAEV